ncbi:hypothetical protein SPRG_04187 [Saprolegnia parasitica CBS 223.65]|uniref:UDENN domain-containing protein n=1 Tax=Saprolegnia parasitica (strain CBS 223.65) TaxID=695850 RepID=A0A067CJS8_SAPPC|nr:hypothetical protein SPRG_04187 [Saprolegnia parasitica CBS 223.65]KDO30999.1 hypothetical protein SPRG_04187 [Saprolegnia parasitica CBS 223.65]|eukprot:XP_012198183.1 hypothetical protein SPRG_04187 [Saprolegnia parasitica CBS 223.65]
MWQTRCEEAERAKAQALREAAAWKKKYIAERERRREMTKTLVVVLQQEQNKSSQNEALVRRFASILSDPNETSAILSPTLPSFDLDGDDEDSTDDEQASSSRGRRVSPPPLHLMLDQHPAPPATVPTRSVRSSTMDIGHAPFSPFSPQHDAKEEGQAMMLNLLYARTFHAGYRSSSKRLQTLAKSITCFHGKRDRIFEHFFIAGIPASSSAIEPVLEDASVGFWKPAILFQYPPAAVYPMNDQAVSSFCFPVGAPAFSCSVADAESLRGSLISQWTSDAASCFRQLLEPFNAQTYTFRLTGSKGEALYGLCAAVLMDADDPPLLLERGHLDAVASDSDADVVVGSSKPRSLPRDASFHSLAGILASPLTDKDGAFFDESPVVLTPRSYCVTSKYPFYKLHYHFLRTLIEADMRSRQVAREAQSALHRPTFVDVTVHQSLLGFTLKRKDDLGTSAAGLSEKDVRLLDAIATPAAKAPDGSVTLSDDRRAMAPPPTKDMAPRVLYRSRSWSASAKKRALPLTAAARPRLQAVVDSVEASMNKAGVRVGDILVAINGFPIGDLAFTESLRLLDAAKRPLKLRFQRIVTKAPRRASSSARLERGRGSSTVLELLRRYRSMKVGEAGSWTSVRLGHCDIKYQFPTDRTDEWTVAVLLTLLSAKNIVLILGHLLLEKQVVIVSDSTAKLAAVSAAFLVLLRPFQWQSTYIPVLPSSLLDFLHSPVPYLVGVHNVFARDEWPDVCFVHLESDDVASPFAPTPFPTSRELETVLMDCQAKMRALPARPPHPWHDLSDAENDVLSLVVSKTECLFSTLCSSISTLSLLPRANKSSYDVLQEEFAKATSSSDHRHFYADFAQTQLFCQYCEDAMHDEVDAPTK